MLYLNLGKLLKPEGLNLLFSWSGIMKILILTTIFFYECLAQKGVLYVYDFFSTNGQILQYEDFCDKFYVLIPFTTYYMVLKC